MFQFPSSGKADPKSPPGAETQQLAIGFQFPSSGKADPKKGNSRQARGPRYHVSIPFKRESGSKGIVVVAFLFIVKVQFQFPSSGKADPKLQTAARRINEDMFQFPSSGKADPKIKKSTDSAKIINMGFNSLQAGKRIQSSGFIHREGPQPGFQFPSSGKADPK